MFRTRLAHDRGYADHGWLRSFHSFSFADYHDPNHMGFRALRVINEDRVAPGKGFGTHPHSDMEIISYVLDGELAHRDSMGNGSVIRPGDVQRMSAGTGVTHSEMNASRSTPVHFLQIWLLPATKGVEPGYEQKTFSVDDKRDRLRLVASPDGAEGSVTLNCDARLFAGCLAPGVRVGHVLASGRHAYVQVLRGQIRVFGQLLSAGDGLAVQEEPVCVIEAVVGASRSSPEETLTSSGRGEDRPYAEVLVFDLA